MDGRHSLVTCGLLLATLLVLPACGSSVSPKPTALTGVEWTLVQSSMNSVDLGSVGITATFDGKQVGGFSGVNQYGGPYAAGEDGSFKAGPLSSTLMAGPEPLMRAEQAYLKLLQACTSYQVESGRLTLSTGAQEALIYEQAKAAQLPGTTWDVTGYNNGRQAVVSTTLGSTLTIDFDTHGTVSGDGGVNTYSGPFTATGAAVTIGPLAATEKGGPKDLMDQETAFLAALQHASTWSITQGRLELRDAQGATQIAATARP